MNKKNVVIAASGVIVAATVAYVVNCGKWGHSSCDCSVCCNTK
ncbi:MAG: hypothetical protein QXI36_02110 [Candidatus Bathyarchaeia archaeon]